MNQHHTLYYRATPGADVQIIRISGEKDPGAVCNTIRDRLFSLTDEERIEQAAHAESVLKKGAK